MLIMGTLQVRTVKIDTSTEKGITKAERVKSIAENKGFRVVTNCNYSGFITTITITSD